jgi:F1F0 ATPase subunit 2
MPMNDPIGLAIAALAGILIGALFFGGLWWTVRRGVRSGQPAVWFLASFLVRTPVAVAGFFFAARGDWRRSIACLLGFLAARILVTRLTRAIPATALENTGENRP